MTTIILVGIVVVLLAFSLADSFGTFLFLTIVPALLIATSVGFSKVEDCNKEKIEAAVSEPESKEVKERVKRLEVRKKELAAEKEAKKPQDEYEVKFYELDLDF